MCGARAPCEQRGARPAARCLLIAGFACAGAVQAGTDDLEVRITPAWDGVVHAGATTEASVALRAPVATTVRVLAESDRLAFERRVALAPHALTTTELLLRPRNGVAQVRIDQSGEDAVTKSIILRTTSRPVVVVATQAVALDAEQANVELLRPVPASWPRHAEAYATVDAVVVDDDHLAALDPQQLAALSEYSAGCGRLLYVGASVPAELRGGCGGRLAHAVTEEGALPAVTALLEQSPPALPTNAALLALLETSSSRVLPIAVLLATYALALALLARARRPVLLLALPLLASLLAIAAFTAAPPRLDRMLWLETVSGDASARGVLLTSVTGRARTTLSLPQPDGWEAPEALDGARVEVDDDGRLVLHTGLLSQQDHVARGVLPTPVGLQLVLSAGHPRIWNAGDDASAPAVLSWRGEHHVVPALAPGADWRPHVATPWPDTAVERLLRARSRADGAALLVPAPATLAGASSWLLVRPIEASS